MTTLICNRLCKECGYHSRAVISCPECGSQMIVPIDYTDINVLYRYTKWFSDNGDNAISLIELPVLKQTDCTWTVKSAYGKHLPKRINKFSRAKYAYPTKEEAWVNFNRRARVNIRILTNQLEEANKWLKLSTHEFSEQPITTKIK